MTKKEKEELVKLLTDIKSFLIQIGKDKSNVGFKLCDKCDEWIKELE